MHYQFTLDTTRERLQEALESFAVICEPTPEHAEQLSLALDRMKTHQKEIEAISMTLRIQGVHQDDFIKALPALSVDQVMVFISQETPESDVEVRYFHD